MAATVVRHAPADPHPRSPQWPACEHAHLRREPACRGCGSRHDLNVHHIVPYHDDPSRELDPENLVTVCRSCHFVLAHRNDWSDFEPDVLAELDRHRKRVEIRHGRADQPGHNPDHGLARAGDEQRAVVRGTPGRGG